MSFPFKIGDKVALKRDPWRKATVVEIAPLSDEVKVLWKIKTTIIKADKLIPIEKSTNQ